MTIKDAVFCVLISVLVPVIMVGIAAGLVWVGLKIGFNLIDYKLMGYVLDD